MSTENTIVAFHIGRGGHYWNPGHLSFIGEYPISHFTNDLSTSFSGIDKAFEKAEEFCKDNGVEFDKDALYSAISVAEFDREFDSLFEKFGITEEDLGDIEYYDGGGNAVGLTETEADSGIGCINIDHQYNTTYTCYLKDCDEKQLLLIHNTDEYVRHEVKQWVAEVLVEMGAISEETEE